MERPRRVLIVEDHPDLVDSFVVALRLQGFDVDAATEPFTDLLAAEPWQDVDVAVVDWMLPGISGGDIVRYLADHQPHIRPVVLSATPSEQIRHDLDGVDVIVLEKPVATSELVEAIRG